MLEMLLVSFLFILLDVAGVYLRLIQDGSKAATVRNDCPIATRALLDVWFNRAWCTFVNLQVEFA